MPRPRPHLARDVVLTVIALGALVAAAFVNVTVAVLLVIMGLGLLVFVVPLVVIHFDEHQERYRRGRPGAGPQA